jgi:hypothetical protein
LQRPEGYTRQEDQGIGRAPACRFLFRGAATFILHFAAVEAHG